MLSRFAILFLISVHKPQTSCFTISPSQRCILNDVSWKLKVKYLNNLMLLDDNNRDVDIQSLILPNNNPNVIFAPKNNRNNKPDDVQSLILRKKNVMLAQELKRNVAIDFLIKSPAKHVKAQQMIVDKDESSISFEETLDPKNDLDFEAMGVHDGLQTDHVDMSKRHFLYRRQEEAAPTVHHAEEVETERDMKLKLFRLMYDTVKDNDELVRKAEAIKKDYDNSNHFEIGFIMGAITDKVNTMSDVALTVERLYNDWKPIEHVNAYEQIANQAIEINHLIDLLESANKKVTKPAKML